MPTRWLPPSRSGMKKNAPKQLPLSTFSCCSLGFDSTLPPPVICEWIHLDVVAKRNADGISQMSYQKNNFDHEMFYVAWLAPDTLSLLKRSASSFLLSTPTLNVPFKSCSIENHRGGKHGMPMSLANTTRSVRNFGTALSAKNVRR